MNIPDKEQLELCLKYLKDYEEREQLKGALVQTNTGAREDAGNQTRKNHPE